MINLEQSSTRGRTISQNNMGVRGVRFARTTTQNNGTVIVRGSGKMPHLKKLQVRGQLKNNRKKYL